MSEKLPAVGAKTVNMFAIEFVKRSQGLFYHYPTAKGEKKEVVIVDVVKERMEGYTRRKFFVCQRSKAFNGAHGIPVQKGIQRLL